MKKMKCYLGLHKWEKRIVVTEQPTLKNNGVMRWARQLHCKHCSASKDRSKEESCYVYMRRNEVK